VIPNPSKLTAKNMSSATGFSITFKENAHENKETWSKYV
jgi:hypothetical protein